MGKSKKRKRNTGQRPVDPNFNGMVYPHQNVNDPEKAAIISKIIQNMVKPPETIGQHIKRLGIRTLSVDVNGEACIALPMSDLVKAEMAEMLKEQERKRDQLSTDLGIKIETVEARPQLSLFDDHDDDNDDPISGVTG